MTERELFAAYRKAGTYEAECACGDLITAPSSDEVEDAINFHHESTVHQQWREWQEAVLALRRPPLHQCPCHGHSSGITTYESDARPPTIEVSSPNIGGRTS